MCLMLMEVDIPEAALSSILQSQHEWKKLRKERSKEDYLHKRYTTIPVSNYVHTVLRHSNNSNMWKRKRSRQHEEAKVYMARMQQLGNVVGEYVGDGQGDTDSMEEDDALELTSVDENQDAETTIDDHEEEAGDSTNGARPLLIFYDCETTGLSIHNDHITEIAAKIIGVPLSSVSLPTFSSLVRTPRHIPAAGL